MLNASILLAEREVEASLGQCPISVFIYIHERIGIHLYPRAFLYSSISIYIYISMSIPVFICVNEHIYIYRTSISIYIHLYP